MMITTQHYHGFMCYLPQRLFCINNHFLQAWDTWDYKIDYKIRDGGLFFFSSTKVE